MDEFQAGYIDSSGKRTSVSAVDGEIDYAFTVAKTDTYTLFIAKTNMEQVHVKSGGTNNAAEPKPGGGINMKKKLIWFQYGICSVILIYGAIDCLYQFIELLTNPWPAPPYAAFVWFLAVYFIPAIVVFFVFELIKRFIK